VGQSLEQDGLSRVSIDDRVSSLQVCLQATNPAANGDGDSGSGGEDGSGVEGRRGTTLYWPLMLGGSIG